MGSLSHRIKRKWECYQRHAAEMKFANYNSGYSFSWVYNYSAIKKYTQQITKVFIENYT